MWYYQNLYYVSVNFFSINTFEQCFHKWFCTVGFIELLPIWNCYNLYFFYLIIFSRLFAFPLSLNHFWSMFTFYTSLKKGSLVFSGGIKWEHWLNMSYKSLCTFLVEHKWFATNKVFGNVEQWNLPLFLSKVMRSLSSNNWPTIFTFLSETKEKHTCIYYI